MMIGPRHGVLGSLILLPLLLCLTPTPASADEGDEAIRGGLEWLVRHQSPSGLWDPVDFVKQCGEKPCEGPDRNDPSGRGPGTGNSAYGVGVTGLCLVACLKGAGWKVKGLDAATTRAADAILKRQKEDGSIGFRAEKGETIYNHALATYALAEFVRVTGNPEAKAALKKAVAFAVKAQNPGLGWRYGIKPGKSDTSVTGLMALALHRVETVSPGLVPEAVFAGAKKWIDRVTSPAAGTVGYMSPGDGGSFLRQNKDKFAGVPTLTAIGIHVRKRLKDDQPEAVTKGLRILEDNPPSWKAEKRSRINFYYWYHGTLAFLTAREAEGAKWAKQARSLLLQNQRKDGDERGSWDPVGEWCIAGGRVYATALGTLTLLEFK